MLLRTRQTLVTSSSLSLILLYINNYSMISIVVKNTLILSDLLYYIHIYTWTAPSTTQTTITSRCSKIIAIHPDNRCTCHSLMVVQFQLSVRRRVLEVWRSARSSSDGQIKKAAMYLVKSYMENTSFIGPLSCTCCPCCSCWSQGDGVATVCGTRKRAKCKNMR